MALCIKMKEQDNVVVAVKDLKAGTEVLSGIFTNCDIPQAHKIALCDIKKGEAIVRYGVTLGYAINDIKKGDWINEKMLILPESPSLDNMKYGTNIVTNLPVPEILTWKGYKNPNGGFGGTRNILGINTTVQCVTGVVNVAIEKIKKDLLPKYPNVDGVVAVNHAYGCGVAINAPEAKVPIRILRNISKHPNFG